MKIKKIGVARTNLRHTAVFIILALCMLVGSIGGYFFMHIYEDVSSYDAYKLDDQSQSTILDQDGKVIYTYGYPKGKFVNYDDISQVMIDAVVAAEDARFFEHDGFDIPRIVKAFISNLSHFRITSGGSTITQQLVKKVYYQDERRTIERKVGEVILATKITKQLSKQRVLELYLNRIYYGMGNNTIGIYAASKYYFDKAPNNLTLPEAALLAGTLNSPYSFDPFHNLELAERRRNIILNLMVQHGYITEAKAEETKKIPVSHMLKTDPVTSDRTYAAYADRVKKEIKEKTKYDPEETVMQITTFFDKDMQDYLNKIAQGKNYKYTDADIQVGSTVQEARTGRILGILAAKDYQQGFTNYAYTEKHQPGSSIKPILDYALAIDKLYWCDKHYLSDSPLKVGNWEPKNYDDENHGVVSMSEALGHSYNLPAIRALQAVLEEMSKTEVKAYLSRAGYDMEKEHFTLPFAIGAWTYGVTPEQQAGAYAAISNNGTYIEPHCVDKITLLNGDVISLDEQAQKESIQLFSTATAYILRKVMTGIVKNDDYKNYRGVNIGDSIGAKTGTTNHDGSIAGIKAGRDKDHWYCCFSPDYAWASWCGYPGFIQTKKKKYLKKNQNDAKSISTMIAKYLHKRKMKYSYEKPDTVVTKTIVKYVYPYRLPGNFSVSTVTGVFAKGHAPSTKITKSEYDKKKLKGFTVSISASGVTYHFSDYGKKAKYHVYVSGVKSYSGKSRSGKISFNAKRAKFYSVTGYVEYDDTYTNEKTVHVRWGYVKPKPKPKPSPTSSAVPSPTPDSSKSTPSSKSSSSKSSKKKSSKKKSSKKKSSKKKSSKKKKKKNH